MLELFTSDQSILSAFASTGLSAYRPFFYAITQLGSPLLLFITATAAFAIGDKKVKAIAMVISISVLFGMVITDDIKNIVERPRPLLSTADPFLYTNDYSFPSGHAVSAFIVASILGAYFGWRYRILGYFVAITIGVSRLMLGVHYPSDVLAGALLGIVLGEMAVYAASRLGIKPKINIISSLLSPIAARGRSRASATKHPANMQLFTVLVAITMIAAILLYYLGGKPYSFGLMALLSMYVVIALPSHLSEKAPNITVICVIAIGLISGFAELFMASEAISLLTLAFTYIAIFLIEDLKVTLIEPDNKNT